MISDLRIETSNLKIENSELHTMIDSLQEYVKSIKESSKILQDIEKRQTIREEQEIGNVYHSVVIGKFKYIDDAQAFLREVVKRGIYDVEICRETNTLKHYVIVGKYRTKEEAEYRKEKLRAEFPKDYFDADIVKVTSSHNN